MNARDVLKQGILLFDGAMGTCLMGQDRRWGDCCELANLMAPELVGQIHRDYINAGCHAIKTNTFRANPQVLGEGQCRQVLQAGWEIATRAAGDRLVFADIGPIAALDEATRLQGYQFVVEEFLKLGAKNFLFETNANALGLAEIARYIKQQERDSFVLVSFAPMPDGFTKDGISVGELLTQMDGEKAVDALGLNCVTSAPHMRQLVEQLPPLEKPLSVMPNAGYPTVVRERAVYHGTPEYFGQQVAALGAMGAEILGGCCGTTPEHIAALAGMLKKTPAKGVTVTASREKQPEPQAENPFWAALQDANQKPFAVELDPPEGANVDKFMAGAKELWDSGAGLITIADCPIARARMDASLLACKLRRELDAQAMPHMTCRDRNLNATKALLLGLCAEDVHNVLVVTGDPIPSASREEVKSVYNFNSRMLARYITGLNETVLPTPFRVFGALNVNARNFHIQLDLAQQKEEMGVCGFLTQPVLTAQGLENLKLARKTLKGKLLGGIIPIVSHKNACFMNSEVAGITVDDAIVTMYQGLDRQQGEDLAVKISTAVAKEIAPYIDGYYLITPFGRTGLMKRIMEEIRKQA